MIASCLRHIKENGFQRIPEPVATPSRKLLVSHQGEFYFMEEWLDPKEIPPHSLPYFKKMGVALAKFHRASAGLPPPKSVPDRNRWGKHPALLAKAGKRLETWSRQVRNASAEAPAQLAFLSTRCQLAQQTIQEVSLHILFQTQPQSAVWCHNALQHRNIMLDRQEQFWWIDFETLAYAERVRDLAHLLEYHAAPYGWPPDAVQQFLSAYESACSIPLSREEWLLLRGHLTFPERLYKRARRCFGRSHSRSKDWHELRKGLQREQMKESLLQHLALLTPGESPEG
ncbi:CotS family spore coat protein [Kroppenstedtia sanguinis]